MKSIILLLVIWSHTVAAQQLALLDRNLKEPFLLRDTFTLQDVAGGAFPLYTQDIPSVILHLESVARQLASPNPLPQVPETYTAQHVQLFLLRRKNLYSCVLQSSNQQFSIPWILGWGTRKSTHKNIGRFIEYLRQNKEVGEAGTKGIQ